MPSPIAEKAIAMISPSVGDFLARAKVTAACKRAHLDVEKLDRKDLAAFAPQLAVICESLGHTVASQLEKNVLAL